MPARTAPCAAAKTVHARLLPNDPIDAARELSAWEKITMSSHWLGLACLGLSVAMYVRGRARANGIEPS